MEPGLVASAGPRYFGFVIGGARGVPLYAALRTLGRRGIAEIIDSSCRHAERMAGILAVADGVEVVNDVVLNQVIARFADDDETTNAVIERTQDDGTCWLQRQHVPRTGGDARVRGRLADHSG